MIRLKGEKSLLVRTYRLSELIDNLRKKFKRKIKQKSEGEVGSSRGLSFACLSFCFALLSSRHNLNILKDVHEGESGKGKYCGKEWVITDETRAQKRQEEKEL